MVVVDDMGYNVMEVGTEESIHESTTGGGTVWLSTKCSCQAVRCLSCSTLFVCLHYLFQFCFLDMPPKKSKKSSGLRKLMGGLCYICETKGYQMGCVHWKVAFHSWCGKHNICFYAPTPQRDDKHHMHGLGE